MADIGADIAVAIMVAGIAPDITVGIVAATAGIIARAMAWEPRRLALHWDWERLPQVRLRREPTPAAIPAMSGTATIGFGPAKQKLDQGA
ncbi:hypothetical protein LMG27198_38200 [Methylocystis echinoides]|uniref:Uncharacterized protein n=1 Tax=Methylocystis echinoides TaxID=29468 RepID=A0A9W6GXD4_9HYPH|nr:hypothetical protein LMG27198_38200 [Methylocystis echinoides]